MGSLAESCLDDLEEGLGARGAGLEHDGKHGKEDDLDGGASGIPVGSGDAVLAGHSG